MKRLKILTWNLGYGAMGAEADVSFEGGKNIIPSSKKAIVKNISGIQKVLEKSKADVFLLQELSSGSLLNRWHNIRHAVQHVLPRHSRNMVSNFSLPLFFDFLRNEHGLGTFVKEKLNIHRKHSSPLAGGELYYKVIRRFDYALTTFVETGDGKVVAFINTHLSSFDIRGTVRIEQFKQLIAYVKKLTKNGYSVVIGADWNMHAGKVNFSKDSDKKQYEKYTHDFPYHLLGDGWTSHFAPNTPTLRAANRPYKKGESTTATVDGFICSPDIQVDSITTLDLDFEHSDHNPVEIVVSQKETN
ncbi:hypothetical protein COB80_01125 [Candidatus Kaiserbacteria bacterium]|nr:MAG: hypothetical protein COB80_01125 [Candidatus Kaiserbacteria bacterium]